ncbi:MULTISPECIES: cobalamin-binding protein [unclassified Oceanobacter]|uniref:cobalamin-binding protein n=1 Tax=unclassified Oceanobacter TaxID=2620260 RepID=UPI002733D906|nr:MULTISPECIES: cobalamin-binding protein [unclassified Oceanobacter]MDP2608672.1 cobalamin-binding protein [Oceanobacter sp. 1_MG-2023]MDP2611768.1 cobalamin-binding protein [Oceanobacter sp. 2_MG-2023]
MRLVHGIGGLWLATVLAVQTAPAMSAGTAPQAASVTPATAVAADRQRLRIIALAPHIVELLYAIGAGEQIIGTTEYANYPEAANHIPRVGSYAGLQIEKILQMKPDLIIAWGTGNPLPDLERLQHYGLPVVYSEVTRLDDVASELRHFGQLTGHEKRAEQQALAYEQRLQQLRHRFAGKAPVRVFYELWSRPLTTVAGNAWPQQQLILCGAHNPFASLDQDYPGVGLEQVIVSAPEVIIQPSHNTNDNSNIDADAVNWSRWPTIPAVKNQQMIHPNADKLHRMTPRALDEIQVLCEQIDRAR